MVQLHFEIMPAEYAETGTDINIMHTHPITLVFSGPDKALEGNFREHRYQSGMPQIRLIMVLGLIFFSIFALLDYFFVPHRLAVFWTIRWGVVCPVILAVFLLTYTKYCKSCLQPAVVLAAFVAGGSLIAMAVMAPMSQQFMYLGGLMQLFFVVFTLLRLRFVWGLFIFFTLTLSFILCAFISGNFPRTRLISAIVFLCSNNILGLVACYVIEYATRRNFYLSRALENQKEDLDTANQSLEKRVSERTAELTRTNQLLAIEVAKRSAVEKSLQESRIHYRRMVNNVTDYLLVHDLDGYIIEANYRMIAGLGYNQNEIARQNISRVMVPEQRSQVPGYLSRLRQGKKTTGKVTFITKSGQFRLMEFSSIVGRQSDNGEVAYCLARDITDSERTEKALAESQERFNNIFQTAAAGMMIVSNSTHLVVEVNPAAIQMIGRAADQIAGEAFDKFVISPPADDTMPTDSGAIDPIECELIADNNEPIPILKTMRPMEFNGQPHWIVSFVSIERIKEAEAAKREAESQLNRSQHLQAIGTLAGGIAHDFNNILYGVIGYTQLALDDAPKGSLLQENLQQVLQGSRRAKDLIAQILTFSRQDDTEKKPIQPAPLIKEALKLLRASIPASVDIKSNIEPMTQMILANPTQLHQVVMNLCTNAAQAMLPQGGLMKVTLGEVMLESEMCSLHGTVLPGPYVQLVVSDTGAGMPESVMKRIFEPFYTTKRQGSGTGMGLAVVLGVVQSHGGYIRVNSDLGKGSTFEVLLPVAKPTQKHEVEHETQTPGGSEHILFVDDEKQLIKMGHQMLTKLGYQVTAVQDPMEALDLFRNDPDAFDLVITDLTMPKMSGIKLSRQILHLRPDLPILMCTGYGDEIPPVKIKETGIRELILKPILRNQLTAAIRRELDINLELNTFPLPQSQ